MRANKSEPLKGTALIPGDKSISHRALILGSLAIGQTIVSNLLESSDVLATANALKKMGAIIKIKDGKENISIDNINVLMFKEKNNVNLLRKVVKLEALSIEWREKFQKRL